MWPWLIGGLVVLVVLLGWLSIRATQFPELRNGLALAVGEPIVLVHGLFGFDRFRLRGRFQLVYFRGIARRLEAAGFVVYAPRLPMIASVPARAERLAAYVRELPHPRVTIFAHSMGGLDSRYAISKLGLSRHVAKLVTIGTPHRGTPMADLYYRGSGPARWLIARMGIRFDALEWLTTQRMKDFSAEVPDVPGVEYFSVATKTSSLRLFPNFSLMAAYWYLRLKSGENDALVPLSSQRWGTCLLEMDANHFDQVGWAWRSHAPLLYERLALQVSEARDEGN